MSDKHNGVKMPKVLKKVVAWSVVFSAPAFFLYAVIAALGWWSIAALIALIVLNWAGLPWAARVIDGEEKENLRDEVVAATMVGRTGPR